MGVGQAKKDEDPAARADRIHNQARHIREKTGSQEKFKKYLRNHADYFESKRTKQGGNGFSTSDWDESDITTDLTLTYYYDRCTGDTEDPYAYFDLHVNLYGGGDAEEGNDEITLSWNDSHYRIENNSSYSSGDTDNLSHRRQELNGTTWSYDDAAACGFGCSDRNIYVGCKAQLLNVDQERGVQGAYWDAYQKTEISGVSFGAGGGVKLTLSNETKVDQHGTVIKEDSDAIDGCSPSGT